MGYVPAAGYGQYQALAAQQGMMGPMMAPQMNILGQAGVMPQTGMAAAPPYMAGVQGGVIGMQNGMMGSMAAVPQQAYGAQQAQQMQWNISQVTSAGITITMLTEQIGFVHPDSPKHFRYIQLKSILILEEHALKG